MAPMQITKDIMTDWTPQTEQAKTWFEGLRTRICNEFEAIEREAGSDAAFEFKSLAAR